MKNELKVLKNVLINTSENNVMPVNILFNDKIMEIEELSGAELSWSDVDSSKKKDIALSNIRKPKYNENLRTIDGEFNLVIPGAIDPHVHFDTPGFEFRDTFENGSNAAAFGGVTTIIDMPCTSLPPVTSLHNFQKKLNAVKNRSLVDFAFWGGVCGNDFKNGSDIQKNIIELNEAGVASYKVYVISGMETFTDLTYSQISKTAEYIKTTGKPMGVHAEDKSLVIQRRDEFQRQNLNSWSYYCKARDEEAEKVAISKMIDIADKTETRVHIVHLSSKSGLEEIKVAQNRGISINTETCPHYLQFTQKDFDNPEIRNYLKTAPPVKNEDDKESLWMGLADGSIAFVATDHAGCNPDKEKSSSNYWEVYGGIPGVEHRVPFLFSEGFMKKRLTLEKTIGLLSKNAAKYFNILNKGRIKKMYSADFALVNLWANETVKSEKMHSKGKYTPFHNFEFNCLVEKTILRGMTIMDRKGIPEVETGYGNFIGIH
jgi:allantoinase